MSISLYAAIIPSYQQIVAAVDGLLDKAVAFCAEKAIDEKVIVLAKLADDMAPFAYQVKSVAEHSVGAIEGVRAGSYSPDTGPFPMDIPALKAKLANAQTFLAALDPAEIDSFIGRDMKFVFGTTMMPFTAENFLLSFAQPNFYFHATTAYDILRAQGVKIGKRDFMGRPRLKL